MNDRPKDRTPSDSTSPDPRLTSVQCHIPLTLALGIGSTAAMSFPYAQRPRRALPVDVEGPAVDPVEAFRTE